VLETVSRANMGGLTVKGAAAQHAVPLSFHETGDKLQSPALCFEVRPVSRCLAQGRQGGMHICPPHCDLAGYLASLSPVYLGSSTRVTRILRRVRILGTAQLAMPRHVLCWAHDVALSG